MSDGQGGWRRCRFGPDLEPTGDIERTAAAEPPITVAFAVVKGERPEWAVQKLTEIGVDRIVLLQSARSVVRWPLGEAGGQLERLARVAREAAVQSRRVWLPVVGPVTTFADAAAPPTGVALAHPGGRPPTLEHPTVLIGPEGGWTDDELASGLATVSLGPTTLRTETAAVVAGTLLCALRTRTVRPQSDSCA